MSVLNKAESTLHPKRFTFFEDKFPNVTSRAFDIALNLSDVSSFDSSFDSLHLSGWHSRASLPHCNVIYLAAKFSHSKNICKAKVLGEL